MQGTFHVRECANVPRLRQTTIICKLLQLTEGIGSANLIKNLELDGSNKKERVAIKRFIDVSQ